MDYQVMFNIVLGGFSFLAGFLLNNVWAEVKSLQATDKSTIDRLSSIEILVAGNYVKRQEFAHTMDRLFTELKEISAKLNSKADR
jgi:hypothetical protein